MDRNFPDTLSALRKGKNISQRQAAADLGISQALLSHYENGAREPGLPFLCRACDYYGVTADYILGRDQSAAGSAPSPASLLDLAEDMRALAGKLESFVK